MCCGSLLSPLLCHSTWGFQITPGMLTLARTSWATGGALLAHQGDLQVEQCLKKQKVSLASEHAVVLCVSESKDLLHSEVSQSLKSLLLCAREGTHGGS